MLSFANEIRRCVNLGSIIQLPDFEVNYKCNSQNHCKLVFFSGWKKYWVFTGNPRLTWAGGLRLLSTRRVMRLQNLRGTGISGCTGNLSRIMRYDNTNFELKFIFNLYFRALSCQLYCMAADLHLHHCRERDFRLGFSGQEGSGRQGKGEMLLIGSSMWRKSSSMLLQVDHYGEVEQL